MSRFSELIRPSDMLKSIAKRSIRAFERRWDYDAAYLREIVEACGVGALGPVRALQTVSGFRRDVPVEVYYAAKVASTRAADCGPCLQLVSAMAEAEGVSAGTLRALVSGAHADLPPDVRLGVDLAEATLARGDAGAVRQSIVERWGRRALLSLAYAIVAGQTFPTLKYALGYGHACARVRVAGNDIDVRAAVTA